MLQYVKIMVSDLDDLEELSDHEFRLIIQACADYVNKGMDPDLSTEDRVVRQAWRIMRAKMTACMAKVDTLTANGSKGKQNGGDARKEEQDMAKPSGETRIALEDSRSPFVDPSPAKSEQKKARQSKAKQIFAKSGKATKRSGKLPDIDIDIDIDRDKDIDKDREREKENPESPEDWIPSLEDVTRYQQERGLRVAPKVFFRYYEQRGWRTGYRAERIQDWRQLMELWEARLDEREKKPRDFEERPNDLPGMDSVPQWLRDKYGDKFGDGGNGGVAHA